MANTIQRSIVLGALLLVAACGTTAVISDIGQDKVKVVASGNDASIIGGKAIEGCAIYKKKPIALSQRCLDNYCIQKEYLFACKEAGG